MRILSIIINFLLSILLLLWGTYMCVRCIVSENIIGIVFLVLACLGGAMLYATYKEINEEN